MLERRLASSGVRPGDRVLLAVFNGPLFYAGMGALLAAGASPILMHAETPSAELSKAAERYGAEFVLRQAPHKALDMIELPDLAPLELTRLDHGPRAARGFPGLPLHPTSGVTSEPKLAARPGAAAIAEAAHYIEAMGIGRSDTIVCLTPMSHAFAYGMCFAVPLLSSATVISMRRFNPRLARRAMDQGGTIVQAAPAMLDVLLRSNAWPRSPRLLVSAGAPVSPESARKYRESLGLFVRPLYGTTETGGISVAMHAGEFDGSVGPPMRGVEVRLRPAPLHGGACGFLQVRSPSMMAGYADLSGVNDADDWFETGDLADIDSGGCIRLRARASEILNVFGHKVFAPEIEQVIGAAPGVREVMVCAEKHRTGSDLIKAVVVAGPADEAAIRRYCELNLAPYKRPSIIAFSDAIPRTPSGKVLRRAPEGRE
jgi:acyl-coenzyme A synthetase/AMP-(fatty) acid ligase